MVEAVEAVEVTQEVQSHNMSCESHRFLPSTVGFQSQWGATFQEPEASTVQCFGCGQRFKAPELLDSVSDADLVQKYREF